MIHPELISQQWLDLLVPVPQAVKSVRGMRTGKRLNVAIVFRWIGRGQLPSAKRIRGVWHVSRGDLFRRARKRTWVAPPVNPAASRRFGEGKAESC